MRVGIGRFLGWPAIVLGLAVHGCSDGERGQNANPVGGGAGTIGGAAGTPSGPAAAGTSSPAPMGGAGVAGGVAGMGTSVAGAGGVSGMSVVAGSGGAGEAGGTGAPGDAGMEPEPEPSTGLFPPITDFAQTGPYTSTTWTATGPNGMYTVYMPEEPPPEGAKNPIVGWMSGGGTTHTLYTLPPLLASHGFVVVAADVVPGIGAEAELGMQIMAGVEWAIAEHDRQGSPLFGRVDVTKVASAGYSMGSLATFMIAADERLTTTVHISGGNMAPERVNNLRKPAAFICGVPGDASCSILDSTCDIAGVNCAMDFENATTPVFYATFASGHLGILTSPFMERINAMTAAWLRWQLMGDTTLEAEFVGDACGYCGDADWTVKQKNLD